MDHRPLSEPGAAPYSQRLLVSGVLILLGELAAVTWPLWRIFDVGSLPAWWVIKVLAVIVGLAMAMWFGTHYLWLTPLREVEALRRAGSPVSRALQDRAYRMSLVAPMRVTALRVALWAACCAGFAVAAWRAGYWSWVQIPRLASLAFTLSVGLAAARGVWLATILRRQRHKFLSVAPPLQAFRDAHFRTLLLVSTVVWGGILAAQAAFLFYFVQVSREKYLRIETGMPLTALGAFLVWALGAWYLMRPVRQYLGQQSGISEGEATDLYRRSQALPYWLAGLTAVVWVLASVEVFLVARGVVGVASDDAIVIVTTVLVVAIAGSIYAALWYRDALRPLLVHMAQRFRVRVSGVAATLSLRTKLLVAFGGVVLLSCGLALSWGFLQYKNQATESVRNHAGLGLAWLRSELQVLVHDHVARPDAAFVASRLTELASVAPYSGMSIYFVSSDGNAVASPGSPDPLPWYIRYRIAQGNGELIPLGQSGLVGRAGMLDVSWQEQRIHLGAAAVFFPHYLGRGGSMVRPLKELLLFFVILFGACAGIVVMTVHQFVRPIRKLEARAERLARGELADPVIASAEGDEIGRLTFALEEMRRALREKLRTTEDINMDLERAVATRTADLANKNAQLAQTLGQLTSTQKQLVRSEKLASIGQLVAGIAHEINNPVNAIVNTVGPLDEAVAEIDKEGTPEQRAVAAEIREMVRVVQRGAQRTKAIVTALHNYSRTDDERVVAFSWERSIDDTLELLGHLVKNGIAVERRYGDVGRVVGRAGQISQVWMNLLTNAMQALAGRPGATVTITTGIASNDRVFAQIRDNGPGIPPDVLPKIFDPFFTTKDVGEGTGLGLSIVHELVERHHGTIEVESDAEQGTRFTVTIPRVATDAPSPRPAA